MRTPPAHHGPSRWACAALAALIAVVAMGEAIRARQSPAGGAAAAPVAIEVRALGPDGQPLLDLKKEEIVLKVGGRVRAIRSFELVRVNLAAPFAFAPSSLENLPPPYAANGGGAKDLPFYRVSFDADAAERTGSKYRVEVTVTRDRMVVHTAPDVTIPGPVTEVMVRYMARATTAFSDLPLRAAAITSGPAPGADKLTVLTLFEPVEPGVRLSQAMVAVFDRSGKLVTQSLVLPTADLKTLPVQIHLLLPPGAYRLRVAAADVSSRMGAVDYDLKVEAPPAPPGTISSLVLGIPKGGAFTPRLQFGPFDAAVVGYLEVYGMPATSTVTVAYELADSVDEMAFATGQSHLAMGIDKLICTGGFNIGTLAPGDYVMRAVVSVDGKVVARAVRTIRKSDR